MSAYYDPDFFAPEPDYDINDDWYDADTLYEISRDEAA